MLGSKHRLWARKTGRRFIQVALLMVIGTPTMPCSPAFRSVIIRIDHTMAGLWMMPLTLFAP